MPSVENIRAMGQVWTPPWVADGMAAFLRPVLEDGLLLDPAVGPGSLIAACARTGASLEQVTAFEIDETVLSEGNKPDIDRFPAAQIGDLRIEDFIEAHVTREYAAVIANPPYIRHHRLSPSTKELCQSISKEVLGYGLDRRAGIQVFFLLKALGLLREGGRLAFLVPADVVEGVFAERLWRGIFASFALRGVVTFAGGSAAFPGVDTNALIVFIERKGPTQKFDLLTWSGPASSEFALAVGEWAEGTLQHPQLLVTSRSAEDGLSAGITRGGSNLSGGGLAFTEVASCMRGIATGGNAFFCLTSSQIHEHALDSSFFVRCIARVRDLARGEVDDDLLAALDAAGRPTFLLNLSTDDQLDDPMRAYLNLGEEMGISGRALVNQRSRWYAMERRVPPPILFTYLGRRSTRFVHNRAGVVPLTGFLCVYPHPGISVEALLTVLNHPDTAVNLAEVGKTYGDGAVKVEPGAMRKLMLPTSALAAGGISRSSLSSLQER